MKENRMIDCMKLYMALVIVLHHGPLMRYSGYLACEFFFMVAGFFMMQRAMETPIQGTIGTTTLNYLFAKYMKLFPILLLSIVIGCCAYYFVGHWHILHVLEYGLLSYTDLFLLQMFGYPGAYITGVSWYLSAMFIAMTILFPIGIRYQHSATPFLILVALALYGICVRVFGGVCLMTQYYGLICFGVLRGFAGVALGASIFSLSQSLKRIKMTRTLENYLAIGGVLLLLGAGICMSIILRKQHDLFILAMIFWGCLFTLTWKEKYNCFIPFSTTLLREISVYLFLNHYYWKVSLNLDADSSSRLFLVYMVLSAFSTALSFFICKTLTKFFKEGNFFVEKS